MAGWLAALGQGGGAQAVQGAGGAQAQGAGGQEKLGDKLKGISKQMDQEAAATTQLMGGMQKVGGQDQINDMVKTESQAPKSLAEAQIANMADLSNGITNPKSKAAEDTEKANQEASLA